MQASDVDFYRRSGAMTDGGARAPLLDGLSREMPALARVAQGLLLHEHWAGAYGAALSNARLQEPHIRSLEAMLDRLLAHDGRPLGEARAPEKRLVGNCRHFSLLFAAMLRRQGVAARARCGFGAYFEPGRFVDHWVCEYWSEDQGRWVMADAQLDELQRAALKLNFDPLDVPRERFLVAGEAWAQAREGKADPEKFGIFDMHGLWFIGGNLLRDVAALNNMEMLPWDCWGAMTEAHDPWDAEKLDFFDRLAAMTRGPEVAVADLRGLYEGDERLRVPPVVFNAVLGCAETL
ncbi:MAG: transglutaminase-like domain-containing protein [Parvibaculum sp.]|uniref:transglutaminase-like domain-containing protein n=1 Tax=Parvibaculum sp. TaxID=2024848 RepID=UPI0025CEBDB8|nr:transglutaminase-like domain-containing protein [Parvibaculum sp.]MCE9649917.1 transglutaminase-like domain-containing protein [Parvibaculum sp.]